MAIRLKQRKRKDNNAGGQAVKYPDKEQITTEVKYIDGKLTVVPKEVGYK